MHASQPLRRIAGTVSIALIVLVVGGLLAFTMGHRGQTRYTLDTGSMSPTIPAGRIVYDGPPTNLKPGDVVTFQADHGEIVTHRLQAIGSDGVITTKGDANRTPDHWLRLVTTRNVVGVVRYVPPAWLSWMLTRMWLVLVLTAGAAGLIWLVGTSVTVAPSQTRTPDMVAVR